MDKTENDEIPLGESHRGVGLHRGQCERRVKVVRANIDRVYRLSSVHDLMDCLRDAALAPEARFYAGAKLLALHDAASKARDPTPIDRDLVSGMTRALRSPKWRSRTRYGSFLGGIDGSVERDHDDEPVADR